MSKGMGFLKFQGDRKGKIQNLNFNGGFRREIRRHSSFSDKHLITFIWANNEMVNKETLAKLNVGDKEAVDEALAQIHWRSLQSTGVDQRRKTYSEVLLGNINSDKMPSDGVNQEWKKVSYKQKSATKPMDKYAKATTIFLHNIHAEATGKDIWGLFNSCGQILDIVLPKKRDKLGKRYGFIKTTSELEAGAIISNAKMDKRLGGRIGMQINKNVEAGKKDVKGKNVDADRRDANGNSNKVSGIHQNSRMQAEWLKAEEQMDFGKKIFEFIEVEVDKEVEEALQECKVAYTWFEEEVGNLQDKFKDMGLSKYRVIALSKRKFLVRKDNSDNWKDFEETDMSVWFCQIRDFMDIDHIISRTAWLECKGLPMPAWREENLKAFTDRFGNWLSWSYQSDDLQQFFNPLICIDTPTLEKIKEDMIILYKGKQIRITFEEI